jgi:sulfate transport system substrate-binding protein
MKTLRLAGAIALGLASAAPAAEPVTLLNVSYDIARELYAAVNPAFAEQWLATTGQTVTIDQSHGGSSRQARAILEGLPADLVTFNQVTDVQILADRGLVAADWQDRLPNRASPYYSLPAFLVRKGNPKNIRDWADLARPEVAPVFPNPKTSGNARYTYLAAWAYALGKGDEADAERFVADILASVPVFDTGGRAATTTFVERGIGDVLVTFEAEVHAIAREYGADGYEIVVPSVSILAEFPVAVVDRTADRRGTRAVAEAYLDFLYSEQGQTILAGFSNRVHHPAVQARFADRFPEVRLVTVEDVFGGWETAMRDHFAEGGSLDRTFVGN